MKREEVVVVLMGGPSTERDVSLETGRGVLKACRSLGYNTLEVTLNKDILGQVSTLNEADVVFNALHGGIGENGILQGFLESIEIPYTGSGPLSSALCMDKHISKTLVQRNGHATPDWTLLQSPEDIPPIDNLEYPVIVKPNDQGSTIGLACVTESGDLDKAIRNAFTYGSQVLVEDYVPGRELTVAILGNRVLPIVEIEPSHDLYDYECKYTKGMSRYFCPADLEPTLAESLQAAALEIFSILRCRHYGRVDFRLDKDGRAHFLEINTLPGMTENSLVPKAAAAVDISFESLIDTILRLGLES